MTDQQPTEPHLDALPPQQPGQPTSPARQGTAWLPWLLVALLSFGLVGTLAWVGLLQNRVAELESAPVASGPPQDVDAPAPSSSAGAGSDSGTAATPRDPNAVTAQPLEGDESKARLALARRDAEDPMALGKTDAKIVIIDWSDYRCPFCAKWALETLPELQPYIDNGSLRVEHRDLVLFGEESELAARAVRAAAMQGKLKEYSALIWGTHTGQGHPTITRDMVLKFAEQAKVPDVKKFTADLDSDAVKKAVTSDTTEARQLGLSGTPFFMVGTTPVSGASPAATFISLLEQYGLKK